MNNQNERVSPFFIWITGLAGSGKTTLGRQIVKEVRKRNVVVVHLDGDDFRRMNGGHFGFSDADRLKNGQALARFCHFLLKQKISVICTTMSLFDQIHQLNRKKFPRVKVVYVKCTSQELLKRDKKQLYSTSKKGHNGQVVGVTQKFDVPKVCDLVIDNTSKKLFSKNVTKVLETIFTEEQ